MKRAILLVATTFVLLLLSPMAVSTASATTPAKAPAPAECTPAAELKPRVVAQKEPICTYVVTPCWLSISFENGDIGTLWEGDLLWGDEDSVEGDLQFVYSYRHARWGWVDWAFIARVACD